MALFLPGSDRLSRLALSTRRMVFCSASLSLICPIISFALESEVPLSAQYRPAARYAATPVAKLFNTDEVTLLPGPFLESRKAAEKNLLSLDVNRLLAPFILESGAEPKYSPYLGWETAYLPGVGLSFYLSGVARIYAATREQAYEERVDTILEQLAECQTRTKGYLLGTSGGFNIFKRLENEGFYPALQFWGKGSSTPYYALEKLMSGLRDVYRLTHNEKALTIERGIGDWLDRHMAQLSDDDLQQIMKVEYGGMNWVLSDLYADTGEERFLAMSRRWQDKIAVAPMVRGEEVLEGKHANMQFPKFSGLAARYPFSGDKGDLAGARFFWESVVRHHSYATGGNSETEHFGHPDQLSSRLTQFTEENCNVYNMLRLTRLLFEIQPDVEYADFLERALYNHILAAQNVASGQLCYFLPLIPGAERVYQPLEFFSCCTASGLDSYTRHAEYIYAHTDDAVYVNLYVPSEVRFKAKGVRLVQETKFPDAETTTFTIHSDRVNQWDLRLRHPYWLAKAMEVRINGRAVEAKPSTDGYIHLSREWREGDSVQVRLPMALRRESMADDPKLVALFYGPILLAGELSAQQADALSATNAKPWLLAGDKPIEAWLSPVASEPLTFKTNVLVPEAVKVVPLFRKPTGHFTVYWRLTTREEISARQKNRQEEQSRLEQLTIDKVIAADESAEKTHELRGVSSTGSGGRGILTDTKWRSSRESYGYTMNVSDREPNLLFARFLGRNAYEGWDCWISVEGHPLQKLVRKWNAPHETYPWTSLFNIPQELTRGKKTVRVTFESLDRKESPRLMEMRVLRAGEGAAAAGLPLQYELSLDELRDRIYGGWLGMLIGGLEGLPHEFKYTEEPRSTLPDFTMLENGARSDDDNDFEWLHLWFMDREGELKLPYPRLVELWKRNMNKGIWFANKRARALMDEGVLPPETGDVSKNKFAWYNLSAQFCTESYGLISPGMPMTAEEISLHYAKVAVSHEPLQAAQFWPSVISQSYFHDGDLPTLLMKGLSSVDERSMIAEAVRDSLAAHAKFPNDWKAARQEIHRKWYVTRKWGTNSTPLNGAAVCLALLYGKSFYETIQYAMAMGYDADCNAATAGVIAGMRSGYRAIAADPHFKTKDRYINYTRPDLPFECSITDQVNVLMRLAERVILENGGERIELKGSRDSQARGQPGYRVKLQDAKSLERLPEHPAGPESSSN